MVNETFSAKRFGQYFLFDLKQLWHNNGKAAIALGFISVICYIVWVVFSLIFTGEWHAPNLPARLVFFVLGSVILLFYQTRTYGYLTEKKAGQSWLMVPASTLEKYVSMMIVTILVIPVAYVISYLSLDGIIGLVDKTAGGPIVTTVMDKVDFIFSTLSEQGYQYRISTFAFPMVIQFIHNLLYFLLCGLCFKKWKILGALGINMLISMVMTPIFTPFVYKYWTPVITANDYDVDPAAISELVNQFMGYAIALNLLLLLGIAAGIYYRLKTLKH